MANQLSGRMIVYTNQVPYDTDVLNTNRFKMADVSWLAESMLGYPIGNTPLVSKLTCTPVSPPGLQVTMGPGVLYQYQPYDATPYGVLPAVTGINQYLYKPYINFYTANFNTPAPINPGNSVIHLVEVIFTTQDVDPVSRPYFNSADPSTPIFIVQPDDRLDFITINVKLGVEAPSPVPPTPDAGYTGLYYVAVTFGQTSIVSGNISVVPGAPFITEGLTQKISANTANNLYLPLQAQYAQVGFNNGQTQTVTLAGATVNFPYVIYDPNSWWSVANSWFVPTIAGTYELTAIVYTLNTAALDNGNFWIVLWKNGIRIQAMQIVSTNTVAGTVGVTVGGGPILVTANGVSDNFYIAYVNQGTGSVTIGSDASVGHFGNIFQIKYVGS